MFTALNAQIIFLLLSLSLCRIIFIHLLLSQTQRGRTSIAVSITPFTWRWDKGLQFPWFPERFHNGRRKTNDKQPEERQRALRDSMRDSNEKFHFLSLVPLFLTEYVQNSLFSVQRVLFSRKNDSLFWDAYIKDKNRWWELNLQNSGVVATRWRPGAVRNIG